MARLHIVVLGVPQITLDNAPVSGFISDKARALLLFLAVEHTQPMRRESLAALLWPEQPEQRARGNLRRALANVRRVIGDADGQFIHVTRQELQFNAHADASVDLNELDRLLDDPAPGLARMEQAMALVQGPFLRGFDIGDSIAFEEWMMVRREQVRQRVLDTLTQLIVWYEGHHQLQTALRHARQHTALDPWHEPGQRQLLRLLARDGQRTAALRHYEQFAQTLSAELGIEPEPDTQELVAAIRDGHLSTAETGAPAFLAEPQPLAATPFVARKAELKRLGEHLSQAVTTGGRILFVTGEAGSGKTRLLQQFAQQAQQHRPDLIPLFGSCHAHVGAGDPYRPIRALLSRLVGDLRTLWYDGTLTRQQANRLWAVRDQAVQLLQATAPDCLATLVDPAALPEADRPPSAAGAVAQDILFQQATRFLQQLSERGPLLLLLDDLQWADSGTIDFLYHLRRQLVGFPILVVCAFRPEEVMAMPQSAEQRHPLSQLVQELRREDGDIELALEHADGRAFVDAWLDVEPNRLGETFRQALFRKTRGHALFTIELVAGMQERGELPRDQYGFRRVGATVSWDDIPARVDAVVAQRIGRLSQPARRLLTVASILGESFAAEIVAQVIDQPSIAVVQLLSGGLGRTHRLVMPQARVQVGQRTLTTYRFRHSVFQQFLYDRLDPTERAYLHARTGAILEHVYAEAGVDLNTVAAELAWHFDAADSAVKALEYRRLAGEYALGLSAHRDAIGHIRRALTLVAGLPASAERTQQEIDLQIALGSALMQVDGYGSAEMKQVYERVYALCRRVEATPHLVTALFWLTSSYAAGGELERAIDVAGQTAAASERASAGGPEPVLAHTMNGLLLFLRGNNVTALEHLERAIALYDPAAHQPHVHALGQDPGMGAMIWRGHALMHMGLFERAEASLRQALASAEALDHPYTLAFTLLLAGCTPSAWYAPDPGRAIRYANETIALAEAGDFVWLQALATFYLGYCAVRFPEESEQATDGFDLMHRGMQLEAASGSQLGVSSRYMSLADAYRRCGRVDDGLDAVAQGEQVIEATGERYFSAELYRVKGDLLAASGDERAAEACWQRAVEIARAQRATLFVKRAMLSLT